MSEQLKKKIFWVLALVITLALAVSFSLILNLRDSSEDMTKEVITTTQQVTTVKEVVATQEQTTIVANVHEGVHQLMIKNFSEEGKKIFGENYNYVYSYVISETRAFYPDADYIDYQGIVTDKELVNDEENVYCFRAVKKK